MTILLGRPSLVRHAGLAVVIAFFLYWLAVAGEVPLLLGVGLLQAALLLALLSLLNAPGAWWVALVAGTAGVAADVVVAQGEGTVGALAGVLGLAFVGGLLAQLARRPRDRVTEALADTMLISALLCSAACLPAVLTSPDGEWPVRIGLAVIGTALAVGRLTDALVPRNFLTPFLTPDAHRGWLGLGLGIAAGIVTAALEKGTHLTTQEALFLGLAVATAASAVDVAADLVADLAAAEITTHPDKRSSRAVRPLTLCVPFALTAPVLLVAVRLLEGGAS